MEYVTCPGTATEGITDFGGFVEWVGGWVSGSVWEGRCMFAAHLDCVSMKCLQLGALVITLDPACFF